LSYKNSLPAGMLLCYGKSDFNNFLLILVCATCFYATSMTSLMPVPTDYVGSQMLLYVCD